VGTASRLPRQVSVAFGHRRQAAGGLTKGAIVARPNFIELPARDLAASRTFFETVFGMTMTSFGPTYACTLTGDVDIGLQADQEEATKAPLPVIEVQDLEATLAAVTATG